MAPAAGSVALTGVAVRHVDGRFGSEGLRIELMKEMSIRELKLKRSAPNLGSGSVQQRTRRMSTTDYRRGTCVRLMVGFVFLVLEANQQWGSGTDRVELSRSRGQGARIPEILDQDVGGQCCSKAGGDNLRLNRSPRGSAQRRQRLGAGIGAHSSTSAGVAALSDTTACYSSFSSYRAA